MTEKNEKYPSLFPRAQSGIFKLLDIKLRKMADTFEKPEPESLLTFLLV